MNKVGLIKAVAAKTGWTQKESEVAVDAVLSTISDTLATGEKVDLVGHGKYEVKTKEAGTAINPKKLKELKDNGVDTVTAREQATVQVAESKKVKFKPYGALTSAVN